jgi:hypothetical protein
VVTFTNTTAHSIIVEQCASDGWLAVGLANKKIAFGPAWSLVACPPVVHLVPGSQRFKFTVETTYLGCVPTAIADSLTPAPICTPKGRPPLPAGHYKTKVVVLGLPDATEMPKPSAVTLLPPTG